MNPPRPDRRRLLATTAGLAATTLLPACGGGSDAAPPPEPPPAPSFHAEGLAGRIVRRLRAADGTWLAATDDGLHRRDAAGTGWLPRGLAGRSVHDVVDTGAGRWLASSRGADPGAPDWRLHETRDGGATWQDVVHDFGGTGAEGAEGIQALAFDGAAGRVLATGFDVLAESTDFGRHWRVLAGDWQGFAHPKDALARHPVTGDIWYGGQDAIEGLVLLRRRAAGGVPDAYPGLLPSPSTTKGIRFDAGDARRVLVSGEGGIVHTRDDGASWQPLLRDGHRFYFDVLQPLARPTRLVSAGWNKSFDEPQPLIVHLSDDDGRSWRTITHPDSRLFGGVWSLALLAQDGSGRSSVLLGLYRGGVVRVELP